MSQSLPPVNPNSPPLKIRASTYNRIAAAVNQVNQTTFGAHAGPTADPLAGVILVRNDTGATLDRFDAVALDGPLVDPADNASQFAARVAFSAAEPDPHKPVAICQQPIKTGKIGPAVIDGVSICKIDVTAAAHGHAVAETGSALLASAPAGPAEILWKATGTGTQWAVVRLDGADAGRIRFGKLKADWTDSQSTLELTPCDAAGNDNGLADVDVYVQNDKIAFDPSTATVAGDSVDIGAKVAEGTIIPYVLDEDGDWIVPAQPHQVIVDSRVYAVEDELQAKVAWSWGWFTTTTSAWLDVGDVFAEDAFTVLTDNADQTAGYLDDEIEVGQVAGQAHTWLGKSVDNTANDHKLRLYLDGPGPVAHTVTLGDGTIIEWDAKGLIVSIKGVAT